MKSDNVLSHTIGRLVEIKLDFDDLTSVQIGTLRAISKDIVDFENVSDSILSTLYGLQEYNLLDSEFKLTATGEKALNLSDKLGGSLERRRAIMSKSLKLNKDDETVICEYDTDSDYDSDSDSDSDDEYRVVSEMLYNQ